MRSVYLIVGCLFLAALGYLLLASHEKPLEIKSLPVQIPNYIYLDTIQPNDVKIALHKYEEFINHHLVMGNAPGAAVAIVSDTSIIFLKGFGQKEFTRNDPVNIHTVFRLGSVSKCFASVLASTFVRQNMFGWDDRVVQYLPDFRLKNSEFTGLLTVRHILSHTTGLPYHAFTNLVEEHLSSDSLIYRLRDVDIIDRPGKVYSYQNVGFSLIGKVIEAVSGKSFESALKANLFDPLHMLDASASFDAITLNPNIAMPHRMVKSRWKPMSISDTYYNVAPAGGVNASIADMALWLKALLGNRQDILEHEQLDELFKPQVRAVMRNANFLMWKRPRASYYALGWRVLTFYNDTIEYHGGYVNGYRSEVALDRKNKIAICVLVNSAGPLADQSIPKFFKIYSHRNKNTVVSQKTNY